MLSEPLNTPKYGWFIALSPFSLFWDFQNSRDRLGHVATTPPPHSPAGAVEYGVRPSSFPVAIDEQGSTNGVNGKKVSFADNYQHTGGVSHVFVCPSMCLSV